MVGDWWTIPGDLGTLRYQYSNGVESYVQLPRGEFFAVADNVLSGLVTISPPSPVLGPGGSQQFTATVLNSPDQSVTWSISPVIGSISADGKYFAPKPIRTSQTVAVTATSVAFPGRSASASLSLTPPGNTGGSLISV